MDLTKKQLNKLMKGDAVQLSHSILQTMHPDLMSSFGHPLIKKITRAVREGRGVRIQLKPEEREVLGGKINWNKVGHDIKSGLKTGAKAVARPLIHGAVTGLTGLATTAIGNPELAPFIAPVANYAVDRALDKAHLGFGSRGKKERGRPRKLISKMGLGKNNIHIDFNDKGAESESDSDSDDDMKACGGSFTTGGTLKSFLKTKIWDKIPASMHQPLIDLGNASIKQAGFGGSFTGGSLKDMLKHKIWDKIPDKFHQPLIDLGKASIKQAGFGRKPKMTTQAEGGTLKTMLKKKVWDKIPDSMHQPLIDLGKASIKQAGFGVGKKEVAKVKSLLVNYLKPHVPQGIKDAKSIADVMFKHGHHAMDSHVVGGKLWHKIKHGAKTIYNYAKPVVKYAGEHAIKMATEYAKPALEEALGTVASSYGIDPSLAKMGSDMMINAGTELAQNKLNEYTTYNPSQTPEQFYGNMHNDVLTTLQNKSSKIPSSISKSQSLPHYTDYIPPSSISSASSSSANPILHDRHHTMVNTHGEHSLTGLGMRRMHRKLYNVDGRVEPMILGGYMIQTHMGTLLDHTNPAMTPFIQPPNLPQGQVSGGSFRGYGRMQTRYGGSFTD